MVEIIVLLAVVFLVIFIFSKYVIVIRQQECIIVERLGKFHAVLNSGLNVLIPFVDQSRAILWSRNGMITNVDRIDMREVVIDIPAQQVITKDNVGINVDAIIYVQITDVKRAAYEIQALPIAVAQLTQTTLRSLVGEMDLDHTLSSRDVINSRLKIVLDEATDKWGLKVNRVELKNVTPPPEVQNAMEKQMQAERERRANVLTAEGSKQSQILNAEGEKRARIEHSEGEKQEKINQALGDQEATVARALGQAKAIESVAAAQAKSIELIKGAFGGPEVAANYLVAMEYLKRFGEMTQKNTDKIFIPYEATAVLSSLGSIGEIMKKVTGDDKLNLPRK
ncbi:SPFH domain-containing protein [Fluviispira multicolorata]|uniref:Protein QmcA n=1 Tax=Fluviispira multicolorata TaxID=2654512 RepID=A0A833N626_9BACT|nr:SPFH domain-containing protein [Fluviispira multicolorata]KAB8032019.1 SPFH/Band 7/PHB domain protein [Fluviispira multicolorata]